MARQAYQEQLLKLNGELIEMGDLCEEAMSLVMKALREKDEEIAVRCIQASDRFSAGSASEDFSYG